MRVSVSQAPVFLMVPDTHMSLSRGLIQMIADIPEHFMFYWSQSQIVVPTIFKCFALNTFFGFYCRKLFWQDQLIQ